MTVLSVDDWIEIDDGDIGLVVDVSKVRRAGGEVAIYVPGHECPRKIEVSRVRGTFPAVLRRKR
jgi:hypothetical protein